MTTHVSHDPSNAHTKAADAAFAKHPNQVGISDTSSVVVDELEDGADDIVI